MPETVTPVPLLRWIAATDCLLTLAVTGAGDLLFRSRGNRNTAVMIAPCGVPHRDTRRRCNHPSHTLIRPIPHLDPKGEVARD
jgi:hypothetical protein